MWPARPRLHRNSAAAADDEDTQQALIPRRHNRSSPISLPDRPGWARRPLSRLLPDAIRIAISPGWNWLDLLRFLVMKGSRWSVAKAWSGGPANIVKLHLRPGRDFFFPRSHVDRSLWTDRRRSDPCQKGSVNHEAPSFNRAQPSNTRNSLYPFCGAIWRRSRLFTKCNRFALNNHQGVMFRALM